MIATDNHLGYQENDKVRRDDSFLALEEVFEQANERSCDLLLLGGDLFHDNSPSKYTLNRTLKLFNKHMVGKSNVSFETLASPYELNYQNSEIQIKMPAFIIHGNHDDPSNDTNISAIHIMQSARYLNYIVCEDREVLHVKPVILQKDDTKISIYGIGNIKEERLNRLFKENKVIFEQPDDEKTGIFILLVHQNRYKGAGLGANAKNCINDSVFPGFIDLVIWGHEHDCFTEFRMCPNRNYRIFQPGSTVSTAITEGEARQKHMFLLSIKKLGYKMTPIPIRNTREILFKSIELKDFAHFSSNCEEKIEEIFEEMIRNASPDKLLKPPLVRLKVEITGFEDFRSFYLNSKFSDKTANKDVILLWKRQIKQLSQQNHIEKPKQSSLFDDIISTVESKLQSKRDELKILNIRQFVERIDKFIRTNESKTLEEYFDGKVKIACEKSGSEVSLFDEVVIRRKIQEVNVSNDEISNKRVPTEVSFFKKNKI